MPDVVENLIQIGLVVLMIMGGWSICNSLATIAEAMKRRSLEPRSADQFGRQSS